MTTQYTPTLKLALPTTGELSGTWGDTVNDNITSMVEQAIAGLSTINTWTANSHTLTTANGTTSESRCAMLVAATGGGAPTAAAEIICPAAAKLYVLQNNTSFAVTLKTSAGTGVAVAAGDTAFLFCDATNVNSCVTTIVDGNITGNLTVGGNATINGNTTLGNATSDTITATGRFNTDLVPSTDNARDLGSAANSWKDLFIDGTATIATLNVTTIDTTNIEVTNIKAKDGTVSIALADSTGVATINAAPVMTALTASQAVFTDASKALVSNTITGTGNVVMSTSPTLVTPVLGTPASGTVTNLTGTASININGTVGATTANTGAFTTLTASTNINSTRINPRTSTVADTATLTPDISTHDQFNLTAQAQALTVAAPTGTPVDGNKLILRILDNGTARAITWNATYTVIGTTLPTTTTINKMIYVGCIYNSTNTRWDVVAVTTQA